MTEHTLGSIPAQTQAAEWLVRLTSGEATHADREAFLRWQASDPEHARAAAEVTNLWRALDQVKPRSRRHARRPQLRFWAAAATVTLIGFVSFKSWHDWRFDYVSLTGQLRTVALQDGSDVELNTDTALSVRFDGHSRHVLLARGEAFFDVAHSPLPFVVEAGSVRVRVRDIGTAFSVRKDEDRGVQVTVERGEVEVQEAAASVELHAGQAVAADTVKTLQMTEADPSIDMAWRRGRLIVVDQPLGSVVRTLNRYRSGVILITNPVVAGRRVNAVVSLANIDDWLKALPQAESVELIKLGPVVWIR